MSEKVPTSLTRLISPHDFLENSIYQSLGLTFSSLAWYIPVQFFGTHSPTLLDYNPALKHLNHVTCHTLCIDWLVLHVKFGDCNQPATFYPIVSPIHHAFTHQIMFATDDFKAPCIHPHSRLSHIMLMSKFHLFHVCTGVS